MKTFWGKWSFYFNTYLCICLFLLHNGFHSKMIVQQKDRQHGQRLGVTSKDHKCSSEVMQWHLRERKNQRRKSKLFGQMFHLLWAKPFRHLPPTSVIRDLLLAAALPFNTWASQYPSDLGVMNITSIYEGVCSCFEMRTQTLQFIKNLIEEKKKTVSNKTQCHG